MMFGLCKSRRRAAWSVTASVVPGDSHTMGAARWYRLGIGLVLVVVALWVLLSRLDPIWNGHPAYPTTLFVTIAIGVSLIGFALWPWRRDPEPNGPPWESNSAPAARTVGGAGRGWRVTGRIIGGVLALLLVVALVWLRPYPAGASALGALTPDELVTVVDAPTTIELVPAVPKDPEVGLVFSPGALVDPRAYADLLRPVAEAGYLVVILKEPFDLAIVQPGQSAGPIDDHPEIARWVVGGHSLGGVTASAFAADNPATVNGLLLWASYPSGDLSGATDLEVTSISGSNDQLATPADIQESRSKLPPDTDFVQIAGGIHAYFADYGEQPGDGAPGIDRDTASAEIVAASLALLDRVGTAAPPA
jgi:hypothetical protein